jgi:signal transduction histidine kinase
VNSVAIINNKRVVLSRLYHAALRLHLKQGSEANMEPAWGLGHHAVTQGIETLDIARIHEIAVASLILPNYTPHTSGVLMGRAAAFFAEVLVPIEKTHRGAAEANIQLNHIIKALNQRTSELAESVTELRLEILQREAVEESLKTSELTTSELLAKSLEMQEDLRHLSRQLLTVQEEERRRISRELHDVIAQSLSGINFRLTELKANSETSREMLCEKIESTQILVEKSVDIVHRFARDLRPSVLDDLGLIPALQAHLQSFMQETGVRAKLTAFGGIEKSENSTLTILYRIAQEALSNVARHSHASHAEVNIVDLDGTIRMEIKDDGIGFEVEGKSCAKKTIRLGLLGMKERIEMIGGSFFIESAPGKSTTIRVEIPPTAASTLFNSGIHHETNQHTIG